MRISDWSSDVCSSDLLIYNPDYDIYSTLAPDRAPGQDLFEEGTFLASGDSAVLMSTQVYGESSLGDWTLRVADTAAGTSGTLEEWSLSLFGGAQTVDARYVYTDQSAALSADDARSAERRAGKACVSQCRYRWSPDH